jgi:hypothetical protein
MGKMKSPPKTHVSFFLFALSNASGFTDLITCTFSASSGSFVCLASFGWAFHLEIFAFRILARSGHLPLEIVGSL